MQHLLKRKLRAIMGEISRGVISMETPIRL